MVRQLPPLASNLTKRLVKSPTVYLRDSAILHALLRSGSIDDLLGHPIAGASWEGWGIEQALVASGPQTTASFFRTAAAQKSVWCWIVRAANASPSKSNSQPRRSLREASGLACRT